MGTDATNTIHGISRILIGGITATEIYAHNGATRKWTISQEPVDYNCLHSHTGVLPFQRKNLKWLFPYQQAKVPRLTSTVII